MRITMIAQQEVTTANVGNIANFLSLLRFEHLNDAFILEPNIGCLVWTYNSTSDCDNCFTYNRFPDCYMVDRSVGWYSGSPC